MKTQDMINELAEIRARLDALIADLCPEQLTIPLEVPRMTVLYESHPKPPKPAWPADCVCLADVERAMGWPGADTHCKPLLRAAGKELPAVKLAIQGVNGRWAVRRVDAIRWVDSHPSLIRETADFLTLHKWRLEAAKETDNG